MACSRARRTRTRCYVRGELRRHTGAKREMRMNVIIYLIFVGSLPLLHSRYYKSTNILALAFFPPTPLSLILSPPPRSHPSPRTTSCFIVVPSRLCESAPTLFRSVSDTRWAGVEARETLAIIESKQRDPVVCIRGPGTNGSQGTLGSITVRTSWNLK